LRLGVAHGRSRRAPRCLTAISMTNPY